MIRIGVWSSATLLFIGLILVPPSLIWPARGISAAAADDSALGRRQMRPAGSLLMDLTTRQIAVGPLPMDFVRSPDRTGPDGRGRYLVAVCSGFGVQFNSATNGAEQSLAVIDLAARPAPAVIQNVYFPSPQSVNVGLVFDTQAGPDGSYPLYASGGFENKIWMLRFNPASRAPIAPASTGADAPLKARYIDVSGFSRQAPSPNYNGDSAPVYPVGLGISPDGQTLYVANNLGDSLGIISDLRGDRRLTRVDLHRGNDKEFVYPYGVAVLPASSGEATRKVYVSCWNTADVAVVDPGHPEKPIGRIGVAGHPTAMAFNESRTRLFVANSGSDSVSVIDTSADREIERISVKLSDKGLPGNTPEGLALSQDGRILYIANAHSNSVAVVNLSAQARGGEPSARQEKGEAHADSRAASKVEGFIPAGQYPSAIAVAGKTVFVANGKGTGFQNSSLVADQSGAAPNIPNDRFPAVSGRGGQYILSLVSGNISVVEQPDAGQLAAYTQEVMQSSGLIDTPRTDLFRGPSPIKHVIYIIKENRTYDQMMGDISRAGNGEPATGDASLAIFGSGDAARRPQGPAQNITPNHHALAERFGLLDHFFVNSEASPDGHNWSTAAFSSDYVDKAYRWQYSRRGRTYDYEGFNRLPDYEPPASLPPVFRLPVSADEVASFMRRFVPYLNGFRDVAEPETLYLWDAAARAGLSYRNYGEFIGTISDADVKSINSGRRKPYPDMTRVTTSFPTKKSLEGHFCPYFKSFDLTTPDSMTVESYSIGRNSGGRIDPVITTSNEDARFRGTSRLGAWLEEFRGYVSDLQKGTDRMPSLAVMRFPNDHTNGIRQGMPTPQFFVAENDYAIGKLVEEVSGSPYWKDTAIFIVEDDAQDGPDHVDAHRSPAFVISAYNRPGCLISQYHSTVSLIRTMEILLGVAPMNQLDANAAPIDIFQESPDLRPYKAILPEVASDNLMQGPATSVASARWMKVSGGQDFQHEDMAHAGALNQIIWFSVRGSEMPRPSIQHLAAVDAMRSAVPEAPVLARRQARW